MPFRVPAQSRAVSAIRGGVLRLLTPIIPRGLLAYRRRGRNPHPTQRTLRHNQFRQRRDHPPTRVTRRHLRPLLRIARRPYRAHLTNHAESLGLRRQQKLAIRASLVGLVPTLTWQSHHLRLGALLRPSAQPTTPSQRRRRLPLLHTARRPLRVHRHKSAEPSQPRRQQPHKPQVAPLRALPQSASAATYPLGDLPNSLTHTKARMLSSPASGKFVVLRRRH